MDLRALFLIAILVSAQTHASVWQLIDNKELAMALTYGIEIANSNTAPATYPYVRVYSVPEEIGECSGKIDSCPDWRLYIAISMGDLYETPFVFRFINSKGWEFVKWRKTNEPDTVRFRLRTVLPDSNVDADVREDWIPDTYEVSVTPNGPRVSMVSDQE